MADRKIAAAYIEVLSKGLGQVQSDLNKLKQVADKAAKPRTLAFSPDTVKQLYQITTAIERVGKVATKAFLAAKVSILGFLAVADPYTMERLGGTLGAIGVQIGSVFIPWLDKAKAALDEVLGFFRSLSDTQKDSITRWVGIGLAVVGAVAVLSKLAPVLAVVKAGITAVGAAIGIASGGIVPLLGVLSALVLGMAAIGGATEAAGGHISPFAAILEALKPIFDVVSAAVTRFVAICQDVFAIVAPVLSRVVKVFVDGFGSIVAALEPAFQAFGTIITTWAAVFSRVLESLIPLFRTVFSAVSSIVGTIAEIFGSLVEAMAPVIEEIGELVAMLIEELTPAVEYALRFIVEGVKLLKPVFETVFKAIAAVIDQVVKSLIFMGAVLKAIASGNISGAFEAGNRAVEDFEARLADRRREREEESARREERARHTEATPGRHTPAANPKIELQGLVDAWKKAQQSVQTENSAEAERTRLATRTADATERSADLLRRIAERESEWGEGGATGDWSE